MLVNIPGRVEFTNVKTSAEVTHNRVLQLDLFLLPVRSVLVFLRLFGSPDSVSFFSESIL
jgi:hypothetical protein